jgi:hypothetical protein
MASKDNLASYMRDYNTKSAQINYLNKSPSSILTRL